MTATVTKKSVTTSQPSLYSITLTLTVTDNGDTWSKDYSQEYRTGENVATKVQGFISLMQTDIDFYKSGKALSSAAGLATAITNIQNGLSL
jgi:hypothetical protein